MTRLEERVFVLWLYARGYLAKRAAMELCGVEDVDAELTRIRAEEEAKWRARVRAEEEPK